MPEPRPKQIWTVGRSNREPEDFLHLLVGVGVEQIADVRRFPGSRRQPHFGEDALRASLGGRTIAYAHFPALGGRRGTPAEDSPNTGWRVASFAAYADYMATEAFQEGLERLEATAASSPMRCSCAAGRSSEHIIAPGRAQPHTLTDFACVHDGALTYLDES